MRFGSSTLVMLLLLCGLWGPHARGDEPGWLEAPLRFHIAMQGGARVADRDFLRRQMAAANQTFAPHRVRFRRTTVGDLEGDHAVLVSRSDRDALADSVSKGAIDVFIVARLMDVDEPGRLRCGVHWRPRHAPEQRLVVVRAGCMDDVLAHELGHYLGLQRHSDVPGNLMSYERGDLPLPLLDTKQVARVRDVLGTLLREGALDRLPPLKQ